MNNELNFPPNFVRLVLGCIDGDFFQVNTRWKALDEIYKIYMLLLHRSDLSSPAQFRHFFVISTLDIQKSLQFCFSNFVTVFADFDEVCSDFLRFS